MDSHQDHSIGIPLFNEKTNKHILSLEEFVSENKKMDSLQSIEIPLFNGQPDQDTLSLEEFLSKIDYSVSAYSFTQEMAYITFANHLRGPAASWFSYFTSVNRSIPLQWNAIRPHFFCAFAAIFKVFRTTTTRRSFYNTNPAASTAPMAHNALLDGDLTFYNNNSASSTAPMASEAILDSDITHTENANGVIVFTRAQTLHIKGMISHELLNLRAELLEAKFDNTTTPQKGGKTKQYNKLFCIYCRKHNHVEEKCRFRIRDQAPENQSYTNSVFH